MSREEFKASNGIVVVHLKDGQLGYTKSMPGGVVEQVGGWLTPDEVSAFTEFVLSQRDAERAPEGSMKVDLGPPPQPSLYEALGDEAAR